jgi:hypothetical protein
VAGRVVANPFAHGQAMRDAVVNLGPVPSGSNGDFFRQVPGVTRWTVITTETGWKRPHMMAAEEKVHHGLRRFFVFVTSFSLAARRGLFRMGWNKSWMNHGG